MKLIDINGDLVNVDVRPAKWPRRHRSKLQTEVADLLQEEFPFDNVLEEFSIPGSRLSLDLFLPKKKVAFEVQGKQHDEYVPHFHGGTHEANLGKQKIRDRQKAEWCELNNIRLIEARTIDDARCAIQSLKN